MQERKDVKKSSKPRKAADESDAVVPTAAPRKSTNKTAVKPKRDRGSGAAAEKRTGRKKRKQGATQRSNAVSASARRRGPARPATMRPELETGRRSPSSSHRHADPNRPVDSDPVFGQLREGGSSTSAAFRSYAHTITSLAPALERALVDHCMQRLLALPISELERIVYRILPHGNHKAVLMHLKAQRRPAAAAAVATDIAPPGPAPSVSPAGARWRASPKVKDPPHEVSIITEASRAPPPRARSGTPTGNRRRDVSGAAGQDASVQRFHEYFVIEVRMAFIGVCGEACLARRGRFYLEQPQMVRDQNVVIPEKVLQPYYIQVVENILYRTLGWAECDAKPYAKTVAGSIRSHMPPVAHAVQPPAAPVDRAAVDTETEPE